MSELQSVDEASTEGVLLPDYRAISGLAIAGLLLGLASILTFVHPVLWVIPLAAVIVCWLALRAIAAQPSTLMGRHAALIGMTVALTCGVSCPIQYVLYRYQLRTEAVATAREWFAALRENRPFVAHQLSLSPEGRWSLDEAALVSRYAEEPTGLKAYVKNPTVRLLLVLGKQCHVRFYEHIGMLSNSSSENILDLYAVTVENQGQRTSFLVRVSLSRTYNLAARQWQWRVSQSDFIQAPPGQVGFDLTRF